MTVNNVNGLELSGNTINFDLPNNNIYFGGRIANASVSEKRLGKDALKAGIIKAENLSDAIILNRSSELFTKYR